MKRMLDGQVKIIGDKTVPSGNPPALLVPEIFHNTRERRDVDVRVRTDTEIPDRVELFAGIEEIVVQEHDPNIVREPLSVSIRRASDRELEIRLSCPPGVAWRSVTIRWMVHFTE